jgi:hypothetical protein
MNYHLFFLAMLCLLFMIIVLILDSIYRPNIPQYPYSKVFDHMIPLIILCGPIGIVYFFPIEISLIQKCSLLLILQILLIPLFKVWSSNRNWTLDEKFK